MNHTSHLGFPVLNTTYPIVIPSNNQHPYPINTAFQPNPLANEESWSSWNTDGSGGGSISLSVLHLIDNGNPHNSKLHGISQPPWRSAVSKIHKLKQTRDINIRSVHIKPSPDETNKTYVLHGISRPKPRNPTSNGSRTCHHARPMAPGTLTRAAEDSRLPARISVTRAAKPALSSSDPFGLRICSHASTSTSALVHVSDTSSATSAVSSRQHHDPDHPDLTREHFDC
uniref:Uncharacterized protein n=1 Tax=Quercus lobata TaxID=97700 RepID=A0A7N2LGJ5_QUELO